MVRSKVFSAMFAVLLTLSAAPSVHSNPADINTSEAYWWWFEQVGTAKLVRSDDGISGNVRVNVSDYVFDSRGLTFTLWIVIFNNPGQCEIPNACGDDADFENAGVMPDVVYGGGNIVGDSGNTAIGFHHKAGDNTGSISDLFFLPTDANGEGFGLRNPRGAEVHYVIRFHGPKDAAAMPEQIQGYPGGCIFQAPYGHDFPAFPGDLYLEHGDCQDVIFAIHSPPQ